MITSELESSLKAVKIPAREQHLSVKLWSSHLFPGQRPCPLLLLMHTHRNLSSCSLSATTHFSTSVPPLPHCCCDTYKIFPASGLPAVSELRKKTPFGVLGFLYLPSTGSYKNSKRQENDWALSISQSKF